VTKSLEEAASLPNGDVAGESESTAEVRASIANHPSPCQCLHGGYLGLICLSVAYLPSVCLIYLFLSISASITFITLKWVNGDSPPRQFVTAVLWFGEPMLGQLSDLTNTRSVGLNSCHDLNKVVTAGVAWMSLGSLPKVDDTWLSILTREQRRLKKVEKMRHRKKTRRTWATSLKTRRRT
jgi:hypothetical protein